MTPPASPPPQPTSQQPTPQQIAAFAGMLASTVPLVGLVAAFATFTGLPRPAAARLLEQAPSRLPATAAGPAGRLVRAGEPSYRAAYLLNAARRVKTAMTAGQTLEEALAAEQRHTVAHVNAQTNRAKTATAVDKAAATHHSTILGWKARMDSRTSAECRAANGRNFDITSPPAIGYPGSVHPHCRCRPVAAFAHAPMVGDQTRKEAVA